MDDGSLAVQGIPSKMHIRKKDGENEVVLFLQKIHIKMDLIMS